MCIFNLNTLTIVDGSFKLIHRPDDLVCGFHINTQINIRAVLHCWNKSSRTITLLTFHRSRLEHLQYLVPLN